MSSRHCDGLLHLISYAVIQLTTSLPPAAPSAFDNNREKLKSWTWIMNSMTRYPAKGFSMHYLSYCSFSLSFWFSLTFTLVLHFSFNPSVVLLHFFSPLSQPCLSSLLVAEDSSASIFHKSKRDRGKERKKVSNGDNTQFDKTDKGLN